MDESNTATTFAIAPPVEPMLAKLAETLPEGGFLYEPNWDGFRAIVFRHVQPLVAGPASMALTVLAATWLLEEAKRHYPDAMPGGA